MGDGQQANNPWLQEFPDPITRVSWDNYLTVSKADAEALGIKNYNVANGGLNGSYVTLKVGDTVLYGKYSGTELAYEGKDILIMRESDIYAIIG